MKRPAPMTLRRAAEFYDQAHTDPAFPPSMQRDARITLRAAVQVMLDALAKYTAADSPPGCEACAVFEANLQDGELHR